MNRIIFIISICCSLLACETSTKKKECKDCLEIKSLGQKMTCFLTPKETIMIGNELIGKSNYWEYYNQISDSIKLMIYEHSSQIPNYCFGSKFWGIDSCLLISKDKEEFLVNVYFSLNVNKDSILTFKKKVNLYNKKIKSGDYDRTTYMGQEIITEDYPDAPIDYVILNLRFSNLNGKIKLFKSKYWNCKDIPISDSYKPSREKDILRQINSNFSTYISICEDKVCFNGITRFYK